MHRRPVPTAAGQRLAASVRRSGDALPKITHNPQPTEGSPRCAMAPRLPAPLRDDAEASSELVPTHRFC